MINKTRIMVYVDSIEDNILFWQDHFDAKIVLKQKLMDGFQNIILEIQHGLELSFFDKEFIEKYSPEVSSHKPSLMFFCENFDYLQKSIPGASDITSIGENLTFSFPDIENNYYVVCKTD